MSDPRIQYARTNDGVSIAYWSQGDGYPLVQSTGAPFNHVQLELQQPNYRVWFDAYANHFRHIRFDARGSGLSDRKVDDVSVEAQALDIEAVADKLGLDRYGLLVTQATTLAGVVLAARSPERISHLILVDGYTDGHRYFQIPQTRAFRAMMEADWEMFTETLASVLFGWSAGEEARRMAAFIRECVDQEDALAYFDAISGVDVTDRLHEIQQPTLVFHHKPIGFPTLDEARKIASRVRDAELILLEGTWQNPENDVAISLRAMEPFFSGLMKPVGDAAQASAQGDIHTILFTDIEGSTALTDRLGDTKARELFREHERITRQVLASHGGMEVKTMGDGFMASFGSSSRAVECAIALQRGIDKWKSEIGQEVAVRIGLNAGEPIAEDDDLFGTAVIVAARIAARAQGGEILVSDVVRQLVAGKGFLFSDRGEQVLRGFEDPVRVYEVRWQE